MGRAIELLEPTVPLRMDRISVVRVVFRLLVTTIFIVIVLGGEWVAVTVIFAVSSSAFTAVSRNSPLCTIVHIFLGKFGGLLNVIHCDWRNDSADRGRFQSHDHRAAAACTAVVLRDKPPIHHRI